MPEIVDLISSDDDSTETQVAAKQKNGFAAARVMGGSNIVTGLNRTTVVNTVGAQDGIKSTLLASTRPVASRLSKAIIDMSLESEDDYGWTRKRKKRRVEAGQIGSDAIITNVNERTPPDWSFRTSAVTRQVEDDIFSTSPVQIDTQESIWPDVSRIAPGQNDTQRSVRASIESLDELSEESPVKNKTVLSSATAALLKEIDGNKAQHKRKAKGKQKVEDVSDDDERPTKSLQDFAAILDPRAGKLSKKRTKDTPESRETSPGKLTLKEQQRLTKAAEKEAAKLARQEAKAAQNIQKQREKDIAAVNKSKLSKDVTMPEMIVDFSAEMDQTTSYNQSREFLRKANAASHVYTSEIPGIIKFRRKIEADFDEAAGQWMPVRPPRIDEEKLILLYLSSEDFARLVSPSPPRTTTLEEHIALVRNLHPDCRLIIIIESLERLIAKEKNASNRAYQAAVRHTAAAAEAAEQEQSNSAQPVRRKQKQPADPVIVDESALEAALLSLQINHSIQVHHTISPLDTGETIRAMTEQLSQLRYRDPPKVTPAQQVLQPNFCMSTGQVPTGKDKDDTYLKVLQQVIRVTEREAVAIARVYPNIGSLFSAFRDNGSKILQDIMKEGGGAKGAKDGAVAAERRIGPATSERLCRIFLGRDEGEMVG